MTSTYNWPANLIYEYRGMIILLIIIIISKIQIILFLSFVVNIYMRCIKKKNRKTVQKTEKTVKLNPNEKKIYVLTKCNTLVNRDLLNRRNVYLKKVKKDYNKLYGQRGVKYFESIQKNIEKPKKNKKVSFSGDIQYSN